MKKKHNTWMILTGLVEIGPIADESQAVVTKSSFTKENEKALSDIRSKAGKSRHPYSNGPIPVVKLSQEGELLETYRSLAAAAHANHCDPATIRLCCTGDRPLFFKGVKFRFAGTYRKHNAMKNAG